MTRTTFYRILLLILAATAIFAIRLSGPTDLEADAQQRNVAYVMDAVWRGNWAAQVEVRGWIMSKPPLHTWVAGAFALIGDVNRLTLSLPSGLAVLGMSLLVYWVGRRRFGELAGWYAGIACVLAPMMARHIALVRTDALFALTIALTAFAALRAWERGGGWLLFWLAAAAATLVKGPLGVVLGAVGLLAYWWERRTDPAVPQLRGSHWSGIVVFLLLTLGWLGLALHAKGYALIDKLFFDELFGQMTGMRKDSVPGENLFKPLLFYLVRFLPFSPLTIYGLWRIYRQPASDVAERRFERFLFCWFVAGLLLFSLGAHFRPDLLLPLWPAGALLAGREMMHLSQRIGERRFVAVSLLVATGLITTVYWGYHQKALKSKEVRYSVEVEKAGHALKHSGLDPDRIEHLDSPASLQMYLGVYRPRIDEEEALRRWRNGEDFYLAIAEPKKYPALLGAEDLALREVFRWPIEKSKKSPTVILYEKTADGH